MVMETPTETLKRSSVLYVKNIREYNMFTIINTNNSNKTLCLYWYTLTYTYIGMQTTDKRTSIYIYVI